MSKNKDKNLLDKRGFFIFKDIYIKIYHNG